MKKKPRENLWFCVRCGAFSIGEGAIKFGRHHDRNTVSDSGYECPASKVRLFREVKRKGKWK